MKVDELLKQIEYLIKLGNNCRIIRNNSGFAASDYYDYSDYVGFKAASLAFLSRVFGDDHSYHTMFKSMVNTQDVSKVKAGVNILKQVKHDIENGWLTSLKQLVAAEFFTDFLEMSEHLLEEGYKDAAAVMIGSTLEEHLRQLCDSVNVNKTVLKGSDLVAKKADVLNADLKKAGVYSALDQKQVTAWLGIRNSAAHGNYLDYTEDQVKIMYSGVLDFITRTSS